MYTVVLQVTFVKTHIITHNCRTATEAYDLILSAKIWDRCTRITANNAHGRMFEATSTPHGWDVTTNCF